MEKIRILVLCTGNSCRSQMAEGWIRHFYADKVDVYSAGIEKHGLNPYAVRVMSEAGVPIDNHASNTVDELPVRDFDYVITVCSNARENCPYFPAKVKVLHKGFDDPPYLTRDMEDEEEILSVYRKVRDEIRDFASSLPEFLGISL
ncbi:arsenate reductase ArsC [Spirochaetia bacterium 38H-sp]|uniref:Arsenate reductase ArsC n=1 Tax=Rarispira pelagica TaxID=3141764 RepID=A0ABU9UAE1_9SPIR